jgi:phosphoribosylglycinamide formyltransferase-1
MILPFGRGSNFRAIAEAVDAGRIDAENALVFSNRKTPRGWPTPAIRGLPVMSLVPSPSPTRSPTTRRSFREAEARKIDLICLAGYMKVLTRNSAALLKPHPEHPFRRCCRRFPASTSSSKPSTGRALI